MTFQPRAHTAIAAFILALASLAAHETAEAQRGRQGRAPVASADERSVIEPSRLTPAFPAQVRCPPIASAYGARTRYDGSARPASEFGGHHGGIDISLPEGTPLLAVAAGTVAAVDRGGMMEGNYLWLRHAPEDSGLSYWVYTKYQHLTALPELAVGTRVAAGQVVARSGLTGTTGGHYGVQGYAHLHMTMVRSDSGDATVGGRGEARGVTMIDPLVLYDETGARAGGAVPIAYLSADGRTVPADARAVWPAACAAR